MAVGVFELQFDNQRTLFLPGQKVEGFVNLNLTANTNITLLRVRLTGKVVTHLQKGNAGLSNENSTITMFKDFTNLVGDGNMNTMPVEVPAGDHVYPFEFRLPPTSLPASFEGPFGSVKYVISAVLVKSGYKKQIIDSEIIIPSTRDVGVSDLADSVSIKKDGYAGLLFWKSGYFSVTASIPKGGFASVTYVTIDRTRGPRTERIHRLNYAEEFPPSIREINRLIQFPVPPSSVMNPDIDTSGFPYLLFEDSMMRRSVDTLPRYVPSTQGSSVDNEWRPNNRGSILFDDTNNSEYELSTANMIPPDLEYPEESDNSDSLNFSVEDLEQRSITPTQLTVLNRQLSGSELQLHSATPGDMGCTKDDLQTASQSKDSEDMSDAMHGMMVTIERSEKC
ncbi:hypothetical protein HDV01_005695 [Terramyces sp. JEL0728]|nr:hypothetical protein HDV01_005695 [Terramyces sp. JEL0728]